MIRPLVPATFAPGENNGKTTGEVPVELYNQTALLLVPVAACVLALNLIFGVRTRHGWLPIDVGSPHETE
ncbi:hypothetical protein [Cryobacterium sp. Y62]|uniref:hypothetical protein n=1 Tax=Cryobacterium sp. Y62 TaxID=2048284 RepID=UPI0011B0168C|nr:hypothetical protein [Cryobacterium sp. Y62]